MSSNTLNFPYFPTPPPPPHVVPQPPHVIPPPPPPSPDNGSTIIIIVFISFGCILFLAFFLLALWCFMKKTKMTTKTTQETNIKESIVEGPSGPQAIVLSIEDHKHVDEEVIQTEKFQGKQMAAKSRGLANDIEGGESCSSAGVLYNHQSPEQKH